MDTRIKINLDDFVGRTIIFAGRKPPILSNILVKLGPYYIYKTKMRALFTRDMYKRLVDRGFHFTETSYTQYLKNSFTPWSPRGKYVPFEILSFCAAQQTVEELLVHSSWPVFTFPPLQMYLACNGGTFRLFESGSVIREGDIGFRYKTLPEFVEALKREYKDLKIIKKDKRTIEFTYAGTSIHNKVNVILGRGEWQAHSEDDARRMAMDYALHS